MARLEGSDPDRSKSTLLIVDDEKGPRESLRMILSPQHRVLLAEDGRKALDILRETSVDAVTVDLNMPGMKGDELMRTIRKEHPQIEVIIITGCSSVETAVDGLRHGVFDYLTKPFDVVEVSNTLRRALARRESRTRLIEFLRGIGEVLGDDRDPAHAMAELSQSPELRARLHAALRRPVADSSDPAEQAPSMRTGEFLESLAETIEAREPHRCGHARRVAFMAGLLAERLGLPAKLREEVRVASFLHDIGRIAEPAQPTPCADAVTDAEAHCAHAVTGALLVEPLGFPPSIAKAIRHHHEHWDGSGTPKGLRAEAIPLISRIVAIADVFDVLTHDHPYRRTLTQCEAVEELRSRAGSQLDPNLLKEIIAIAESGQSTAGPLLGLAFQSGEDPVDTIAAATVWIENER
jgi:putative nucleotidyltransferase with HDIG domain